MKRMIWRTVFPRFRSLPLVASAQERSDDKKTAVDRWRQMSPQEKQELRERYELRESLSPGETGGLQRKLETW
ncbi:MAG: DUF3106 domain-containing protein [Deltaproteobacteria bacterium]|nr:DUF3106 domain-containing protein [Deltaproteobacteria bacterium]